MLLLMKHSNVPFGIDMERTQHNKPLSGRTAAVDVVVHHELQRQTLHTFLYAAEDWYQ